jgi:hypothetical protein
MVLLMSTNSKPKPQNPQPPENGSQPNQKTQPIDELIAIRKELVEMRKELTQFKQGLVGRIALGVGLAGLTSFVVFYALILILTLLAATVRSAPVSEQLDRSSQKKPGEITCYTDPDSEACNRLRGR